MARVTRIDPTTRSEIEKKKVCAYCRVSRSTADQLNSYARQIRVYTDLIKRNPSWQLVEISADEGITGTSAAKRPEFQRMLKMCEQKQIDLIITKSISRFARNTMEALEIVRRLKILGIAVQFEKEGIYTLSLGDEMLLNTFTAIAQEESIAISERIRYSNTKRMESGEFVDGNAPFGYGNSDQSFGMFQYRWTGSRCGTHRAKDYGGHLWRSCSARRRSIFRKGCNNSRSFWCLHGKIHCKESCKSRTRRLLSGRHFVCHRESRTSCCFG